MEAARSEESSGAFSMELNSFIFSFCIQDLSNITSLIGCIRSVISDELNSSSQHCGRSELWDLVGEMACRHIVAMVYSCNSLPVNLIRNDIHGLNFEF